MYKKYGIALLLILLALGLVVSQTAARATKTEFTGTATTIWLDWGDVEYLLNHIKVRNLTHEDAITSDSPYLDGGHNFLVVNANLDLNGNGRMFGTFRLVMPDGTWEGHYSGSVTNSWAAFEANGVAHGTGAYEGMKLHLTNNTGSLSGYMLNPHGD